MNKTIGMLCLAGLASLTSASQAGPPGVSVATLLETDTTILGQPFEYPEGQAKITALVLTVPPHATIALHEHPVPLFVYVLQGQITVDYESVGPITYQAGDTFVEAFEWPHSAHNAGRGLVKILTVYAGADGVSNSVQLPD